MKAQRLKLMAEYGGTVLWGVDPADLGPIDPDSLPLTQDLRAATLRWADAYDGTLNPDRPLDSGFATPAEEEAFEAEGLRLWHELRRQLGPGWSVAYLSRQDCKLRE